MIPEHSLPEFKGTYCHLLSRDYRILIPASFRRTLRSLISSLAVVPELGMPIHVLQFEDMIEVVPFSTPLSSALDKYKSSIENLVSDYLTYIPSSCWDGKMQLYEDELYHLGISPGDPVWLFGTGQTFQMLGQVAYNRWQKEQVPLYDKGLIIPFDFS